MPALPNLIAPILCKQAQQTFWDKFTEAHPWLHTAGYFNPLTAVPTSAMDAINEARKGNYGRAALNSVWALGSLVPGGAQILGLARLGRIGRAMNGTGKAFIQRAPASAKSVLGKPFAGIRNAYRNVVNPIKGVGNEFMAGFAGAPGTKPIGQWLDRTSKAGIKGLSKLQGGSKSMYSKGIQALMYPAMGASMLDLGQNGVTDASELARLKPAIPRSIGGFKPDYRDVTKRASIKVAQTQTFSDIVEAILNDPSLSQGERSAAITALRRAFPMAGPYTVITPGMAGAAGAAVAWVLSRYADMAPPIQALASIAGFGLGRAIHDNLTNPYKGYRQIG